MSKMQSEMTKCGVSFLLLLPLLNALFCFESGIINFLNINDAEIISVKINAVGT